jgi:PLP dependent protein
MIKENLALVRKRIEKAAKRSGRSPSDICLISVTKAATVRQTQEAVSSGALDIGENRVKDALLKYNTLGNAAKGLRWHMIGHLQTNKVARCLEIFDVIHSLEDLGLAREINRQAGIIGRQVDCFVEINVSGEASKHGISPGEARNFIRQTADLPNINIIGLMTMAPISQDPESSRQYFKQLRILRDSLRQDMVDGLGIKELSMGMTQDFEIAIEEGATFIRIGTAIFNA